ncbi:MAG: NADH-quinone oxidoreductase subunit A [Bacillota bacterium]|nr:MAG: NADH-quinone oxidoreductase subunit A [Bacillota bacterium]
MFTISRSPARRISALDGAKGATQLDSQLWVDILVFLIAGATFPMVNVAVSRLLRRDWRDPAKLTTYETGIRPYGDARVRYSVHYYIFALIFLVFDVEVVFLYPWAVRFSKLGAFAFVEMFIFITMLVVGLVYAWKKKVLRWA